MHVTNLKKIHEDTNLIITKVKSILVTKLKALYEVTKRKNVKLPKKEPSLNDV